MIDEKEVLKILKRYEGRMNPTAYFSLEADIVNIEALNQEPTTKNSLGVDYRSLDDIKKLIERKADDLDGVMLDAGGVIIGLYFAIANDLPSVTPQEPRKGHWIDREVYDADRWKCSECGRTEQWKENFCPNCGADMREVEE